MKRVSFRSGYAVATVVGVLSVTAMTGCEHPTNETTDYRVEHKLTTEERVFSLQLNVADSDRRFEARDETNMREFAREYLRRGRGPFLITTLDGDEARAQRIFDRIAALIVTEGVPGDRVYFQVRSAGKQRPDWARLSFSGYYIRLPECGDWSGETGFAPSNQPHSDFSCSYQRNFGLMLANPGDLTISRKAGVGDAFRTDRVVGTYRSGGAFGRPKPALEQGEFSEVK